jgi:hypothetical protein
VSTAYRSAVRPRLTKAESFGSSSTIRILISNPSYVRRISPR